MWKKSKFVFVSDESEDTILKNIVENVELIKKNIQLSLDQHLKIIDFYASKNNEIEKNMYFEMK